ncbi:MAG: hypothetical protein MUC87_10030 [Bacteroidia bacterium]|jgi:hypothetical protein|nr:hypothetical protein [Bacteroidia bacterium]
MKYAVVLGILCAAPLYAQTEKKFFPNWGVNFQINSNSVTYTNERFPESGKLQSSSFLSPGIGAFVVPYSNNRMNIIVNTGYQKRGSADFIYVPPVDLSNTIVDADERFQTLNSDIQLRFQFNRPRINPYLGLGGGINYVFKRQNGLGNRISQDDIVTLPGIPIVPATGYRYFTSKFVASAGINVNHLLEFDLSVNIDQQAVLANESVRMWLWTNSLTIRLNIPELMRLEKAKKSSAGR